MDVRISGVGLYALPVGFVLLLVALYFSDWRAGIRSAAVFFALSLVAGVWIIVRADDPGLGWMALPFTSTVAGLLGLGFGVGWRSPNLISRLASRLCLIAGTLLIAGQFVTGK